MHNLLSRNQLAEWIHIEEHLERANDELDLVNDYFDCLIEFRMDRPEKRVIFEEAPTPEKFEVVDIKVFVVGSTDLPQLFP